MALERKNHRLFIGCRNKLLVVMNADNGKVVDRAFGLKGRGEIEDDIKKILGPGKVAQK